MTKNKRYVDNGYEAIEDQSFTDTETDKTYWVDYFDEIVDLVNEQDKEISELKQTIKGVYEILSIDVDVFSDKAIEHDINAYIELKELDNKDAYCIAKGTKKAIELLKKVI